MLHRIDWVSLFYVTLLAMIPLLMGVCTTTLCLPKVCDDSICFEVSASEAPSCAVGKCVHETPGFMQKDSRNGQFGLLQRLTGLASTVADKTLPQIPSILVVKS